ncbi:MAG: hypothetical protein BIFFINMI_03531 [Phycisphaerae bacterium]|nr:hypothetical protein [Phycisphaerae bacterium]
MNVRAIGPRHVGILLALLALSAARTADAGVEIRHRWIYISTNLQVDAQAARVVDLMQQAARAGYNGIMLADYKLNKLGEVPPNYFANLRKVEAEAKRLKLDLVPCIFPIGYSNGLLGHDPNLASGLPVRDAPFVVRGGQLVPDDPLSLAGGEFESVSRRGVFTGWDWQDPDAGLDRNVKHGGAASARIADIAKHSPDHGHGRISRKLAVQPFRYYHLSVWVRTEGFERASDVRIQVLAGSRSLQQQSLGLKPTQDWTRVDVAFNTLDNREVNLYLGVWGGKGGTLWFDDAKLEPGGFVNVLRRDGCPLKITSADGKTTYVEGKDFARIADPKLGREPYGGEYQAWHAPPKVTLPPGSALKEGDRVLASYYHPAIVYNHQMSCELTEPKLYDLLGDQMRRVDEAFGDSAAGYMMSHDEYRVGGWDALADAKGWTTGQWMAWNLQRCTQIARTQRPGVPLYVWSDLFDPSHNAHADYYLVKGTLAGSWEGLDKDVVVINWYFAARAKNLAWFAGRGNRQILAGYYDGDPTRIKTWLADADKVDGVIGVMYTTWQNKYGDMERFSKSVDEFLAARKQSDAH